MKRRVYIDDLIARGYLLPETTLLRVLCGGWDDRLQRLLVRRDLLVSRS